MAHLRGQEIGKTLGGEPIDVVDGVALPGQRVDKHPRPGGHSCLCNLQSQNILSLDLNSASKDKQLPYFTCMYTVHRLESCGVMVNSTISLDC